LLKPLLPKTVMNKHETIYREAQAQAIAANGAGWLHDTQSEALERFLEQGFPPAKLENWRYTDLSAMAVATPELLGQSASGSAAELPETANHRLLFVNGRFDATGSQIKDLPEGVVLGTLADAEANSELLVADPEAASSLRALNTALLNDAAIIHIPDNTVLDKLVHVVFSNTAGATVFPRLVVMLGKNAHATVIEHHVGSGAAVSNVITDIVCADGAQLSYQKLQEEDGDTYHVAAQTIRLQKDARCDVVNIDLGAKLARNDLRIEFAGSGAEAAANGLFLVDGERHVDNHVHLEHQAPHTGNRVHYAGVISDKARGVFNGMIHVHQAAQKTDAALYNKNVLLTKGAEINTKPELEIYADDVKCAHGSTTGQLDANSLFYLRARGVPELEARNMLVHAFAIEVIQKLASDGLREYVQASVEKRLSGSNG